MPTPQEIETAVATLTRENRRISVRNVRSVLPRGGSYSDIGPVLAAWKTSVNYQPKELSREVPSSVASIRDEFAARLWAAAREEAGRIVEQDRAADPELKREFETEAAVAWAEVDRLTDEVAQLRRRLADSGIRVDPVFPGGPALVEPAIAEDANLAIADKPPGRSPDPTWRRDQPKALRKRLYQEAVLKMATSAIANSEEGALTASQILATLPSELRTKADDAKRLRSMNLFWMLEGWAREGLGFVRRDDGRYGLDSSP